MAFTPVLKYDVNPWLLTAIYLPLVSLPIWYFALWSKFVSLNTANSNDLFTVALFLLVCSACVSVALLLMQAAFKWSIFQACFPAFFSRVDHPLHFLDRLRWFCAVVCGGLLVWLGLQSPGPMFAFSLLPGPRIREGSYDQLPAAFEAYGDRLLEVDGILDENRMASTSYCTCEHCYSVACPMPRPLIPQGMDSMETPSRLLRGAGGGHSSGGGYSSGRRRRCAATCVYAAPILPVDEASTSGCPVAFAIHRDTPPFSAPPLVSGTAHYEWWGGRAEAIYHEAASLTGSNLMCRVQPFLYTIDPHSGSWCFLMMLLLSVICLPCPWALAASILWTRGWEAQSKQFLDYAAEHERQEEADQWFRTATLDGPVTVRLCAEVNEVPPSVNRNEAQTWWLGSAASFWGGYDQLPRAPEHELRGFHSTSLLLHVRRIAADRLDLNLEDVGLKRDGQELPCQSDFMTLEELNIRNGTSISGFKRPGRTSSWRKGLAGKFEQSLFDCWCRHRDVARAGLCEHIERGELQYVDASPAVFGESYKEGWVCDACEKRFPRSQMMNRCIACSLDFCNDCVRAARSGAR